MKLGPLLCGRKARRTQIVPRNFFQAVGFVVQQVRPVGAGMVWGERCLMGRKWLKEAGWDEAKTTSLW